jgi:glycosyltransferase involved in cell wall biosynthesis
LLPQIGASLRYAFLSFPAVADTYIPLVRHHCPTARIIYDMVDFHALRMVREAALMQDAALAVNAAEMEVVELTAARAADITVAISGIEKESMLERLPRAVIEVLPNVFQIPPGSPPGSSGRRNVFFVGGFWHRPNSDAVIWFVESIWPRIRAGAPDVRFVIAGSNPGPEVLALAKVPGVEVMGWVADLAPLFDAARVFVAPLRYGAGVKGKVGQSLVHGLPVVATSVGAEGMQLVDGVHLLIADDPERFADQVLRLLVDDELWNRLQREARDYVERSFSVEALREKVAALFHA